MAMLIRQLKRYLLITPTLYKVIYSLSLGCDHIFRISRDFLCNTQAYDVRINHILDFPFISTGHLIGNYVCVKVVVIEHHVNQFRASRR